MAGKKKHKIRVRMSITEAENYTHESIMMVEHEEIVPPGRSSGEFLKEAVEREWKRVMGTRLDLVHPGSVEESKAS